MDTGMNELAAQLRLGQQVACPNEPTEDVEARVVARVTDDEARRRATLDAGADPHAAMASVEEVERPERPERWQEESERRQERQEG